MMADPYGSFPFDAAHPHGERCSDVACCPPTEPRPLVELTEAECEAVVDALLEAP